MIERLAGIGLLLLLVGVAAPAVAAPDIAIIEWQEDGAAENGFRDGIQKVFPEARFWVYSAAGNPRLLEKQLGHARDRRHDLFYVSGTPATRRLLQVITDVPVVFTMVQDPIGEGIIASWRASENNATGVSNRVPIVNQLKALKRVRPFRRLGAFFDPRNPDATEQVYELARLQPFLGFELVRFPLESREEAQNISLPGDPPVDAVYLPFDPLIHSLGGTLLQRINRAGLPSLAEDMNLVTRRGALLGLVPDNYQVGRLAAQNALAVLQGTPPAAVPSRSLDFFMVVINMPTARAIEVQIPFSLLVIADTIVR
jgi:putative ABC transport system substrate-binding protein